MSCDGINGYDVRLYHPQLAQQNLTRSVNGNFFTLIDEDRLVNNHETLVQVTIDVPQTQLVLNVTLIGDELQLVQLVSQVKSPWAALYMYSVHVTVVL